VRTVWGLEGEVGDIPLRTHGHALVRSVVIAGKWSWSGFWFYEESGQRVILSRFLLSYLRTLRDKVEEERPVNIVSEHDDVGWPGVGARGLYDVKGSRLTGSNGVALGHLCCPGNGIRG
jgi:hypothetical protein